jgi:serine O-acetyltransferase
MIRTRDDLAAYQAADARMNGVDRWRPYHAVTRGVVHFLHVMRLCEYWENQRGPLAAALAVVYKVRMRRLSERLGFDLGRHAIGPGFSIAHSGLLVVHPDARIGARCRIHQGVTIGAGRNGYPVIGDDVFIGPNAVILGGVTIGDGAFIYPSAVVTKDVPQGWAASGVPAVARPSQHAIWRPDGDRPRG